MDITGGPYGSLVEAQNAVHPSGRGYDRAVKYQVTMYWNESDNTFVGELPELPGCMADSPTNADALRADEHVAQEWIETAKDLGWPVPKGQSRLKSA